MKSFITGSALFSWLLLAAEMTLVYSSGLRGQDKAMPDETQSQRFLMGNSDPSRPLLLKAGEPGSLGTLDLDQPTLLSPSFQASLAAQLGGSGRELLVEKSRNTDNDGRLHVRFYQEVQGLRVEGASLVIHADEDGTIDSVNGEFVRVDEDKETMLASMVNGASSTQSNADYLLNQAVEEAGVQRGEWVGDKPTLTVVRRPQDGSACVAFRRLYQYMAHDGNDSGLSVHADMIFADATSGPSSDGKGVFDGLFSEGVDANVKPMPKLCASLPMILGSGIPTMETYDCQESYGDNCVLVSENPGPILTGDVALDAAHNNAYLTYQYFWDGFGRDSMDGAGMPLISRVHYGVDYNNAFWDGTRMTYGDGDGVIFIPLSQGLDVVAHELTHGLTTSTSNLVYRGESGALNEAMSDIFAALVEHENGYPDEDVWKLGEAVYTFHIPGDALRSLSDPQLYGDYDFYPTRYVGNADNGGVHWNSGIANLAFYLLVNGGTHPRGATDIVVPKIGWVNAAYIFYHANVNCLTPSSNFWMARVCTAEIFGGHYKDAVHKAWDAVGVPHDPPVIYWLISGVQIKGQEGANWETLRYMLGPIQQGDRVACTTSANNGDADLYVRFGLPAEVNPASVENACYSYRYGSYESCTTGPVQTPVTTVHVAIHAWESFSNLSLVCEVIPAPTPPPPAPPASDTPADDASDTPAGDP
ncbi:Extracellular elastase [Seminavis robusta]|uniref:Extracellular elastase n=1 Tax=Seminavis robusta TaxID=568900 RepID=A0A9N8EXB0_9STRA|nr:Extracellular elastase [Seminavis robusta]|eukprot:Sro1829_g300280.1 Extracellular elastase (700) ;mRNA; r:16240-18433